MTTSLGVGVLRQTLAPDLAHGKQKRTAAPRRAL